MNNKLNIDVKSIEWSLLDSQFLEESLQLVDLDNLTDYERKLLNKCLNHEEFNEEEFKDLKKLLNDYRPYLEKYKPEETIEAFEKTKKTIKTEKDFLDMVENRNNILKINIPFEGELYPVDLEILPLDDSRMIKTLTDHVDLFKGLDPDEIVLFNDQQQGKKLDPKEEAIANKVMREIEERATENRLKVIEDLLASQTRIKGSDADYETRLRFWKRFNYQAKFTIYFEVERFLGLNSDVITDLFRDD